MQHSNYLRVSTSKKSIVTLMKHFWCIAIPFFYSFLSRWSFYSMNAFIRKGIFDRSSHCRCDYLLKNKCKMIDWSLRSIEIFFRKHRIILFFPLRWQINIFPPPPFLFFSSSLLEGKPFVTSSFLFRITRRDIIFSIGNWTMENFTNETMILARAYDQCTFTNGILIRFVGSAIFCIGIISTFLSIYVFTRKELRKSSWSHISLIASHTSSIV